MAGAIYYQYTRIHAIPVWLPPLGLHRSSGAIFYTKRLVQQTSIYIRVYTVRGGRLCTDDRDLKQCVLRRTRSISSFRDKLMGYNKVYSAKRHGVPPLDLDSVVVGIIIVTSLVITVNRIKCIANHTHTYT